MLRIVRVSAEVIPLSDVIVQPFTGRVVRQIIFKIAEKSRAHKLVTLLSSRQPFKPYSLTPLYLNGKPLYKTSESRERLLMLRRGRSYEFSFAFMFLSEDDISVLKGFNGRVELYGSKEVEVLVSSATVHYEGGMGVPLSPNKSVMISFDTPTLLQLPKIRKRTKLNRYMLFPVPSLIIYSLKQGWNTYADEKVKLASWRANYSLLAVDYALKPVTAIYDERRRIRGFTGKVIYKIMTRNKKVLTALSKLLHFAELMNIGKSRSTGFGVVRILESP
ncbi:MAG: CRISPR-associated endoribonuclease Cas6 [Thermoprotei archaeon]|nr:MAG: CRISPR-associated endoribonuclease Cas6 [Thermoprotei archaeon]